MQKSDYFNARLNFFKAIECSPSNGQSHFNLAVLLTSKLGEHEEALKLVEEAIKLG